MDNIPLQGYLEEYKVDIALFHTFRVINLDKGLIIRPLTLQQLDLETKVFYLNSHYDEIKKYLPDIYPETEEKAGEIISSILYGTMLHRQIIFAICLEEKNFPIGYIVCSSPLTMFKNSTEPVGDWLIDFWLNKDFHNKGIMTHAMPFLFTYLSEFRIPNILAFTDKTNLASISVLNKLSFNQTNELDDKNFYSFRRPITFENIGIAKNDDEERIINQAIKLSNNEDYYNVIRLLEDLVKGDSNRIDVFTYMAYAKFMTGNRYQAENYFNKAIAMYPTGQVHISHSKS